MIIVYLVFIRKKKGGEIKYSTTGESGDDVLILREKSYQINRCCYIHRCHYVIYTDLKIIDFVLRFRTLISCTINCAF